MIYFIQQGATGPIKIGYTKKTIQYRMSTLQTGCPEKLQLLATAEGGRLEETAIHGLFAKHRMEGEWFKPAQEIFNYLFPVPEPHAERYHFCFTQLPMDLDTELDIFENMCLKKALKESNGSKMKAAKLLNISFRSFRYRLEKHNLT